VPPQDSLAISPNTEAEAAVQAITDQIQIMSRLK
jgi:hypothetical protein